MAEVIQQQRTDIWDKDRLGKFTASEIYKLMGVPKSKGDIFTATAYAYILDKVSEELTGFAPVKNGEALVWGIEQEVIAKQWFSTITGKTVQEVGFIPFDEYSGGSPDGIVEDGIIEIKCPFNTVNHIKHILDSNNFRSNFPEYYWQMQMNMLVTKKDKAYFISFDPRIDADSGMFIKEIARDQADIDLMIEKIKEATEAKKSILNKLK
jgi:hypothetical protein